MNIIKAIIIITLSLSLNSCLNRTISSGHTEILEENIFNKIMEKQAQKALTKEDLLLELGSPEIISNIDGEKWFYLTSISNTKSFMNPVIKHNYIIVFSFNVDQVENIKQINDFKPQNFIFATGKTPSKGDDTNFYKEIFGNVGRFNVNRNTSLK